ncbi:hypothetical protein [Agrococcus jejuensis]|uniref:hypothetical protein n=1 Tax=Agrococcus jejuensis TaxID=399736 RepID=UPI00119C99AD|nr:hypothetical protein [Agrococcus jejuensis]
MALTTRRKQPLPARDSAPGIDPAWISPTDGFEPFESEFILGMFVLGFEKIAPQQWRVFEVCESRDSFGRHLYGQVAVDVPRRSGKSESTTAIAIGRCLERPGYRVAIVFASTGTKLAARWKMDVFERIEGWADQHWPTLKITRSNGHEAIDFGNGSQIMLLPPKASSFRSEAFDLIIIDEGGEASVALTSVLLQSAGPTMDTRPDAQLIIAGTPADFRAGNLLWDALEQGKADIDADRAEVLDDDESILHGIVKYGIREELTVEDVETWDLVRPLVERGHPGVGTLTTMRAIKQNYDRIGGERFAQEYLGQFGRDATTAGIINPGKWNGAEVDGDLETVRPDHFALGVAVSFDQSFSAIGIAWRVDGVAHVGLVAYERGSDWLVERVNGIAAKYPRAPIVYDAKGQINVEVEKITQARARTRLQRQSWLEVQTAAALLVREVHTARLRHYGQEALTQAALIASRRGDERSFAFGRPTPEAQIVALEAVSLALRVYDETPAKRAPMRYVA